MHLPRFLRVTRRGQALAASGLLALSLSTLVSAEAVDNPAIFELDRNAVDGASAGDDWANIHAGNDDALATTGILADPAGQSIFTGGSTKDDLDISGWQHTTGSVPDKNEITNAYAAAYDDAGDLTVYFGLDKLAVNGNSNVGFWFLQNSLPAPLPAGGFGISHEVGDVLVLSEFTNGGAVSTIQVYEWHPGPGAVNGTLRKLVDSNAADCTSPSHPSAACATVNQGNTPSPWPYSPKAGPANIFAKGAFFEGGVNLSQLFPGGTPCFSSFLAETRSSQSVDAVLKDFTLGSFPLCDAAIQISGSAVNEVGDDHTFTVDVQKILGGSSQAAADGTIVDVDLTAANGAVVNLINDSCAAPGTVNGTCTVTFDSASAGVITGHASASVMVGDSAIDVETDGSGTNSGDVTKRFVDARIGIDPDDVNGIGEAHTFTVTATMDTGDGNGFVAAPTGHVVVGLSNAGGAVDEVTGNSCGTAPLDGTQDNLNASGQCAITFHSDTAGTVTGGADAKIVVSTAQGNITLDRSTDGANGNTDDAVKTFVDGSLTWLKVDDLGNPLGGATFQACRTHDYASATGTFVDITPDVCIENILDNSAPDTNATAGTFVLQDLVLGRWVITEAAAPEGYSLDATPQTVELTTTAPNGQAAAAFVNPALFKVIVLTCNTSTERLVVSEVDEDPGTAGGKKDTQAAGALTDAQQAAICALEASYDNRTRGTHHYSVTIPKP